MNGSENDTVSGSRSSPAPHEMTRQQQHAAVASLLCVAALMALRRPDMVVNPQFWAEDGVVYFRQALLGGVDTVFAAYNGYLSIIPRLVAWLSLGLPVAMAPAVYAYCALGITLAVTLGFFSTRLDLPLQARVGAALLLVLGTHSTGEVFMNITNIHWITSLWLPVMVLQSQPQRPAGWALDTTILTLVALTGPFVILALPLFALRALFKRDRYSAFLLGAAAVLATIQVFVLISTQRQVPGGEDGFTNWFDLLTLRIAGTVYLGPLVNRIAREWTVLIEILMFAATVGIFAGLKPGARRVAAVFLAFGLAVVVATVYKFRADIDVLIPQVNGQRYLYAFNFGVGLVGVLGAAAGRNRWVRAGGVGLLAALLTASMLAGFRAPALIDYRWEEYADVIEQGQAVEVPINPEGWKVRLPARE